MTALWAWITDHATVLSAVVSAISTVIVAAFTVGLFRATSRQSQLLGRSIDLTRDEFNATHRPRIIVRAFQMLSDHGLKDGEAPNWAFIVQNVGDSRANIIQVHSGTYVLRDKKRIPSDLSFPFHEDITVSLASGEKELFPANGGTPLEPNEAMAIFAGEKVLLCMGIVTYLDESGRQRETGFCRRYRSREQEWDIMKDSEYEYTY